MLEHRIISQKLSSLANFIGELQGKIQMINGESGMIAIIVKDICLFSQLLEKRRNRSK